MDLHSRLGPLPHQAEDRSRAVNRSASPSGKRSLQGNGKAYLVIQKTAGTYGEKTRDAFGVFTTVEDANNSLRAKANSWVDVKKWKVERGHDGSLSLNSEEGGDKRVSLHIDCYTIKSAGSVSVTKLKARTVSHHLSPVILEAKPSQSDSDGEEDESRDVERRGG